MIHRSLLSALCVLVLGSFGCTHTMEVRNLGEFQRQASSDRSYTFAIEGVGSDRDQTEFVDAVREGLAEHPSVERVAYARDWQTWTPEGSDEGPDFTIRIAPSTSYEGSGVNYLVTFPGFLVFAHAWNGFKYSALVSTTVTVEGANGRRSEKSVSADYDIRHCDFERGAWTSSGWWTPGWGGLNVIIGFFMIKYDVDATEEFVEAVRPSYGRYVANEAIAMVAAQEPAFQPGPDPEPIGDAGAERSLESCFNKCLELTSRSREECFDACR